MPVIAPSKPTAPTRPQKAEPKNYPLIAHVAFLDFQLAKCDIDVILERLHTYHWRLSKAAFWFDTHERDDPLYREATALRSQLEHDECGDRALLQSRAVGALYHLFNCVLAVEHCIFDDALYASVSALDDLSSVVAHCKAERGAGDHVTRAKAIVTTTWGEMLHHCPIPAHMPDDHRANWVEYRLGCVPVWSMDELQEALDEKRKK